jgi:hypothetical protein
MGLVGWGVSGGGVSGQWLVELWWLGRVKAKLVERTGVLCAVKVGHRRKDGPCRAGGSGRGQGTGVVWAAERFLLMEKKDFC